MPLPPKFNFVSQKDGNAFFNACQPTGQTCVSRILETSVYFSPNPNKMSSKSREKSKLDTFKEIACRFLIENIKMSRMFHHGFFMIFPDIQKYFVVLLPPKTGIFEKCWLKISLKEVTFYWKSHKNILNFPVHKMRTWLETIGVFYLELAYTRGKKPF